MESTFRDRSTKIDFFDVPDLSEHDPPPLASVRSTLTKTAPHRGPSAPTTLIRDAIAPIIDTLPSSKTQRGFAPQGHPAPKRHKHTTAKQNPVISGSGPKDLNLVQAAESGVSVLDATSIRHESPWNSLRNDYGLNLDKSVSIVSARAKPYDSFIVKRLHGPGTVGKCFNFEGSHYAVFEHVPISLAHLVKSPPYLRESELVAILGQILEGLAYLAKHNLEHGSLSCSNILLTARGDINISGQECCVEIAVGQPCLRDVRALGYITMELMQKYSNENGAIGLEKFDRYASDGDAVNFLAMTTSATSVDELLQHQLFQRGWEKGHLKWLVGLALAATHTGFKYNELVKGMS